MTANSRKATDYKKKRAKGKVPNMLTKGSSYAGMFLSEREKTELSKGERSKIGDYLRGEFKNLKMLPKFGWEEVVELFMMDDIFKVLEKGDKDNASHSVYRATHWRVI